MKKLLVLLALICISVSVFARKQYVFLYADHFQDGNAYIYLNGAVIDNDASILKPVGDVLESLAEKGYTVDSQSATEGKLFVVLSKEGSSTSDAAELKDTKSISEVARYNLQGQSISAKEKGIQIIVFSDYSTKTLINE